MFAIEKYSNIVPYQVEEDKEVGAIFLLIQLQLPSRIAYIRHCITVPHRMYKSGDFDDMVSVISTAGSKKVYVTYRLTRNIITKKYCVAGFSVNLNKLADDLHDDRFKKAEVAYTQICYKNEKLTE